MASTSWLTGSVKTISSTPSYPRLAGDLEGGGDRLRVHRAGGQGHAGRRYADRRRPARAAPERCLAPAAGLVGALARGGADPWATCDAGGVRARRRISRGRAATGLTGASRPRSEAAPTDVLAVGRSSP